MAKLRIANILSQHPDANDTQKALAIYDEIIQHNPPNRVLAEEALLRKGLTLTLFGKYKQALDQLEAFILQYPQNTYVQRNLIQENINENLKGWIDSNFRKENYLAILGVYKDYQRYFSQFPPDITLFQVAVSYQKLGLFDNALDLFKLLSTQGDPSIQLLSRFQEAAALSEKTELVQARESWLHFIHDFQGGPYDADAKKQLAQVYRRSGQYEDAIKVYQQAIQQYQNDPSPLVSELVPEFHYEVASLQDTLGHEAAAADAYAETIQAYQHPLTAPDVPSYIIESHFFLADQLFSLKKNEEALDAYQQAILRYQPNQNPDVQDRLYWARYQIGVIYQRTQREPLALKQFKTLMEIPGEEKSWKKLAKENYELLNRKLSYEKYLKQ